jgi:hypothetical protein
MITTAFRENFKMKLGENFNYSPEVKKILMEDGITNRNGNFFSSQSIRNVFNGIRENKAIEIALFKCYKIEVQRNLLYQNLNKSFKTKKSTKSLLGNTNN